MVAATKQARSDANSKAVKKQSGWLRKLQGAWSPSPCKGSGTCNCLKTSCHSKEAGTCPGAVTSGLGPFQLGAPRKRHARNLPRSARHRFVRSALWCAGGVVDHLEGQLHSIFSAPNIKISNDRTGLTRSTILLILFIVIHVVGGLHVFMGPLISALIWLKFKRSRLDCRRIR